MLKKLIDGAPDFDTTNREQALAIVGLYYSIQRLRIGASNKVSAHERHVDVLADSALVKILKKDLHRIEKKAAVGLEIYAQSQPLGRWAMSHLGVGHIIAAGLLAHIDIARAPSVGKIWRFAGLDPTCVWKKGHKRPYNAVLKTLCWKLGESFKKVSSKPDAFYGQLYKRRKAFELREDAAGKHADQARARLEKAIKARWDISPEQHKMWASGHLQPIGLDLRAMRWAVKFFLAHYHAVGRSIVCGEDVKPWILVHGGHVDYIAPPNWPMVEEE